MFYSGKTDCDISGGMRILRSVNGISWTDGETNEVVLQGTDEDRGLVREIGRGQSGMCGRIVGRVRLENLVTDGGFDGEGARGRSREPRDTCLDCLSA